MFKQRWQQQKHAQVPRYIRTLRVQYLTSHKCLYELFNTQSRLAALVLARNTIFVLFAFRPNKTSGKEGVHAEPGGGDQVPRLPRYARATKEAVMTEL